MDREFLLATTSRGFVRKVTIRDDVTRYGIGLRSLMAPDAWQELFGIRTEVDRPKFLAALRMPTDDPIADINSG